MLFEKIENKQKKRPELARFLQSPLKAFPARRAFAIKTNFPKHFLNRSKQEKIVKGICHFPYLVMSSPPPPPRLSHPPFQIPPATSKKQSLQIPREDSAVVVAIAAAACCRQTRFSTCFAKPCFKKISTYLVSIFAFYFSLFES